MPTSRADPALSSANAGVDAELDIVRQSLARLKFGAIQLVVHDGRLVQIDITEKRRFPS